MRRSALSLVSIVCAALVAVACQPVEDFIGWMKDDPVVLAKRRVEFVFSGMNRQSSTPFETVVDRWYNGKLQNLDVDIGTVTGKFDAWSARKGLHRHDVEEYHIISAEPGKKPGTVIVRGTVNGKDFRLRVTEGKPLAWM